MFDFKIKTYNLNWNTNKEAVEIYAINLFKAENYKRIKLLKSNNYILTALPKSNNYRLIKLPKSNSYRLMTLLKSNNYRLIMLLKPNNYTTNCINKPPMVYIAVLTASIGAFINFSVLKYTNQPLKISNWQICKITNGSFF